jgi:lactose/L-arabinose transport system substrate-binding protein
MGGASFILPKDGENADLAWLFYEFLMFDEAGYTAVWGPNDVYPEGLNTSIPAYLPAADPSAPLFNPVAAFGDQDLWAVATEAGAQIPGSVPTPTWWAGAVDYLGNNIQRMLDGELTPQEVISQSSEEIQTNLIDRQ